VNQNIDSKNVEIWVKCKGVSGIPHNAIFKYVDTMFNLRLHTIKSSAQVQYNYNTITQKFCCIASVRTSAIQLQYHNTKILLYCVSPHKCNTTAIQVFLQLLQVACKFSTICRKLVLQRCNCRDPHKCNTTAMQEKILVLQLYCTCADHFTVITH